jgi:hypothetical protein
VNNDRISNTHIEDEIKENDINKLENASEKKEEGESELQQSKLKK